MSTTTPTTTRPPVTPKRKPKSARRVWHHVTRQFACLDCGMTYAPAMPLSMRMFSVIGKEFNRSHRLCKPTPHGEALAAELSAAWEAAGKPEGMTFDIFLPETATDGDKLLHALVMKRVAESGALPDGVTITRKPKGTP
jgi:hypothetical protein